MQVGWPGLDWGFAKEAPEFREDAPTPAIHDQLEDLILTKHFWKQVAA